MIQENEKQRRTLVRPCQQQIDSAAAIKAAIRTLRTLTSQERKLKEAGLPLHALVQIGALWRVGYVL